MIKYNCIMSVDPSINYCGWGAYVKADSQWRIAGKGLIKPNKELGDDEYIKSKDVYKQVASGIKICEGKFGKVLLVLETPAHWAIGGFEARESGNMGKLHFLCGMLYTLSDTFLVYPANWKGQYPKPVVRNRMIRIFKEENSGIVDADKLAIELEKINHNTMDAIGIGYWYLYKREKGKVI